MYKHGWERDEKPYLVFSCKKCHQFSYVKITQKTKKCLRCGHIHRVSSIINTGQIAHGITKALELVKKKQEEIVQNLQFKTDNSFDLITNDVHESIKQKILCKKAHQDNFQSTVMEEENYNIRFKKILTELASLHSTFPKYMIEMMADDNCIPNHEIPKLLRIMVKQGFLGYSRENDHYFLSN